MYCRTTIKPTIRRTTTPRRPGAKATHPKKQPQTPKPEKKPAPVRQALHGQSSHERPQRYENSNAEPGSATEVAERLASGEFDHLADPEEPGPDPKEAAAAGKRLAEDARRQGYIR